MISILLITGREGAGKSTVADYLCTHHAYEELSFAGTLRTAAVMAWNDIVSMFETSGLLPASPELHMTIERTLNQSTKEIPLRTDAGQLTMADGRAFTPRVLLQWFGTDVLRTHVADDIWVHSTLLHMIKRIAAGQTRFVISDCRFENELSAVRSFVHTHCGPNVDCKLVRLLPGNVSTVELEAMKTAALSAHPSARGWVTLPADIEIYNPFNTEMKYTWLSSVARHILPPHFMEYTSEEDMSEEDASDTSDECV